MARAVKANLASVVRLQRNTTRSGMASPTSATTENPEVPRAKGGTYSKRTPAAMDNIDATHSDERPSQGQWLSEAPPTGVLTGVLGEMAFYYGACWSHHRSVQRPGKTR